MLLLLLLRGLRRRGLERRLISILALLRLPITSLGRFVVSVPLLFTMLFSLEASPEGGSHWGCPIALSLVNEGRINEHQKTYLGAVGLYDLVIKPWIMAIRSCWMDDKNVLPSNSTTSP